MAQDITQTVKMVVLVHLDRMWLPAVDMVQTVTGVTQVDTAALDTAAT
jgi:hypothetical protein